MISYCHKDGPFAGRLADALRANNCKIWFDDGIRVGDKFPHLIHNKINDAAAVLVVWSNSACASDWVRAEVLQAFDLGKPLIPVIKEPCAPLPVPFNLYQRIDLSNWTFEPSSSQIQKIVAALPTLDEPQIDDDPKPRTKLQEVAPFLQENAQIKTIDRIAIGELSDVYRGEYGRRTLAIKAFPNSLLPTATQEALLAEVALASNLNHPAFLLNFPRAIRWTCLLCRFGSRERRGNDRS
jgi:hypothetical protein